jgi:hypothetical protein
MKRLIFLGVWLLALNSLQAQDPGDPAVQDAKVQERIKNLRIAYITDKLGLTPDQAEKFWPVYREFSDKRREIRQSFANTQKEMNPQNPSQADQEKMVKMGLELKQKELDLEKDYSGRLMKIITAQQM